MKADKDTITLREPQSGHTYHYDRTTGKLVHWFHKEGKDPDPIPSCCAEPSYDWWIEDLRKEGYVEIASEKS